MATADATGIRGRDLTGYLDLFRALYRDKFGEDLALEDETVAGQLIGLQATSMTLNDESIVYLANAMSLARAAGRHLDDHGTLLLIPRLGATRTVVTCRLTGASGTVIPKGSKARTLENAQFASTAEAILDANGVATVVFEAVEIGPVPCDAGALNIIVSLVSGWESISNPEAAIQGKDAEADADYRTRLRAQSMRSAVAPPDALRAAVIEAGAGVKSRVIENNTAVTVINQGIPILPHSILVIADGGEATAIQAAVLRHKSAGCGITAYMSSGDPTLTGFTDHRLFGWQGNNNSITWAGGDDTGAEYAAKIQAAINGGTPSTVEALTRLAFLPDPKSRFVLAYPWLPDGDYSTPTGNLAAAAGFRMASTNAIIALQAPGAFVRPQARTITASATVTVVDGFPADGLSRIRKAVRDEAAKLGIGEKPWPQNFLKAIEGVPGTQVTEYEVLDGPSETDIADVTMPLDRLYSMEVDPDITLAT